MAISNGVKILITGGCGFLGSNLAREAMQRKYEFVIFDDLSRTGSEENLKWLVNTYRSNVSVPEQIDRENQYAAADNPLSFVKILS